MLLAFTFPIHDWQFWAVTTCAVLAIVYLFRGLIFPKRMKKRRGTQKVTLTIDRKNPEG